MTTAQQDAASDAICRRADDHCAADMTEMMREVGPDGMLNLAACYEANAALVRMQARRAREWQRTSASVVYPVQE